MGRAPCCEKVGLKKGKWTAEEDEILMKYIQVHGEGSWRSLPKNAGLLRCGKSCRLRWMNYLRADVKRGNISAEEEETIIKLHGTLGNRWSLIAGHLPGRTDNEIKNYWNSHLSRRIHIFKSKTDDGSPVIMDIGRIGGRSKRRGGKVKRSPTNTAVVEAESNSQQMAAAGHHEEAPSNAIPSEEEGRESLFSDPHGRLGCGGATSNIQEPDQCFFCPNDDGMDGWLVGLNELIEGGCSSNEEAENGGRATGESDGWCSSMAHGLDSLGRMQDQWLQWEWEGMEGQMLINDGGRETRAASFGLREYDNEEQLSSSWLWDNDLEELQVGRKARVF